MTQKIIALVDGSTYSASVCQHAAWVGQRTAAPVELLHVLGRREASDTHDRSGAIQLGARSALLAELAELDAQRAKLVNQRGRAILEDAEAMVRAAGVNDITSRLRPGDVVETVEAVEADARVIVMGKRGEAADFAKGHLGSNLERIVRASHRPVLVAARAFQPIQTVVIAYDGGASADKAVGVVAESPVFRGLAIRVVTVGSETPQTRHSLDAACDRLRHAGLDTQGQIMPGAPEQALGTLADSGACQMLVMGAYGHSRIRTLIIGSTTTEMIRSCKVPVVLIR